MAKRIILPGLSRSTKCSSKTCQRLSGHKGSHRVTLGATKSPVVQKAVQQKAVGRRLEVAEGGVEVASADRYTVQPTKSARKAPATKARKARRPKVGRTITIPMADYVRMVADSSNGKFRTARRARLAPDTSRRELSVSKALGL